jgi:uncharacterized protein YggE
MRQLAGGTIGKGQMAMVGLIASSLVISACATAGASGRPRANPTLAQSCTPGSARVTVSGSGVASGPPNTATISLDVSTMAASAAAAMASNNSRSRALIATLEHDGIAPARIQTADLSVQPNYNQAGTVITGYQVDNSVTVTLHDIAFAGKAIDDAARAAGNAIRVTSVSLSLQDDTALDDAARAAAVRQARSYAGALARAAGMVLGPLCSLTDNGSSSPPPITYGQPSAVAKTTPVEPGTQEVTDNVTAVYELAR